MDRRTFFKFGAITLGTVITTFALSSNTALASNKEFKTSKSKETSTICPFCGVGCGLIVSTKEGNIINIEGDNDNPINEGSLCSKGSALFQVAVNERRLKHVLYRAPGAKEWEKKDWLWAIEKIAKNIKETRDKTFETEKDGKIVNRTQGIAQLGGAAHDNEECYLLSKFARALGINWLEHQARLCHSSTVAALAASFGRGAMTNHFNDLMNSDVIMVMGSNIVEMHPMATKWIMKAKEKGAKIISSDPRFTRTSSIADIYTKFRSGTDIAYVGGMINYAISNDRIQHNYLLNCTNASFIVNEGYFFNNGLFAGYNPEKRKYDKKMWVYETDAKNNIKKDTTLQHPRCVFQLLKKHYERYDVDTVCNITGTPVDDYLKVCDLFTSTYPENKSATWCYAMGATQHTVGTQYIRTYAILQLLLGNIGIAGGGINALRGESNVQGSTDMALLFHILPGYLACPEPDDVDLKTYIEKYTPKSADPKSANWWGNYSKYITSLLKAWWGENAQPDTDGGYAFNYLPKKSGVNDFMSLFENIYKGKTEGLLIWGMNPAVGGPNLNKERKALEKLKWMVVAELWETETAEFWKRPDVDPSAIQTEVFLLPACSSVEKEGSIANSGRWTQWRYAAIHPGDEGWHGDARSDLWIVDALFKAVRKEYNNGGKFPDPILKLNWDYNSGDNIDVDIEPDVHAVASEINGYFIENGVRKGQVPGFAKLTDDGTSACGNWVYCGGYVSWGNTEGDKSAPNYVKNYLGEFSNRYARRIAEKDEPKTMALISEGRAPGMNHNWSWCWPVNRRILYNRASVDSNGEPLNKERWVIRWNPNLNEGKGAFEGDVPDGPWAPSEKYPFIMTEEGVGRIFSPKPNEGPFPEHYEPLETPISVNPFSEQMLNPVVILYHKGDELNKELNAIGLSNEFPIVATTFRLTEHWQGGAMTRNLAWQSELMPNLFVEISKELATEKNISNGDKVSVITARGKVSAFALVTNRFEPVIIKDNGVEKKIHQIGLPWHYGYSGIATGDSANLLTPHVGDGNTNIPEYKTFLCNIEKV
ncbi:MAG: formate dehydrogenase-N subunit alpha [Bacteroidetes bacterium GWA2_30_7]|nr:MAG: formate dehydrogenase-N subunit alpha [Bacteroidetes bacterium GWA2_30_7]